MGILLILQRVGSGAIVLMAAVLVTQVFMAFGGRLFFPFDLEWMEGGMLAHAWRLQRGLPLYGPPSPDFVPFVYPPGYSAIVAALGDVFGLDYTVGRVVSIGSTLLSATAIVALARRHTGSWVGGIAGAACFLGLFRASGGFYDIVRPDALALALLTWSVVFATERARGSEVASGLLLCASFLVKHNFAAFGLPLLGMIVLRWGLPAAQRFTLASAGPALAMTALLQWRSAGGFLTYVLGVPGSHPMLWNRFWIGLAGEVGLVLLPCLVGLGVLLLSVAWSERARPILLGTGGAVVVAALIGLLVPDVTSVPMTRTSLVGAYAALALLLGATAAIVSVRGPDWRLVGAVGVGGLAMLIAAFMRAHIGGFLNVVMPAHWALATGLGLGLGWALERAPSPVAPWAGLGFAAVQLGWLLGRTDFVDIQPLPVAIEAGDALIDEIGDACPEGPILMPTASWIPVRLGRPPSVHLIGMWDLDHSGGPFYEENAGMLRQAAREGYWPCAVQGPAKTSGINLGNSGFRLNRHYRRKKRLSVRARRLMPETGWRVRSEEILEPRP